MTAVRDTLCNLRPLEIPRPHIPGLQFITTRGRQGFYKSIRRDGAQYGLQIKAMGPRRPALADACWNATKTPINNNNSEQEGASAQQSHVSMKLNSETQHPSGVNSSDEDSRRSSQLSNLSSGSLQKTMTRKEPVVPEPDYEGSQEAPKNTGVLDPKENAKPPTGKPKLPTGKIKFNRV